MSNETNEKVPWRKNLDKRYISGEDLKNGIELGKGLKPEMVVTLSKFNDAPTFDQKLQQEVSKTAIWLSEYPSGKQLYKPVILNVSNGEFLEKEIGGGSIFISDFDTTKPFIIYAKPDRRHGFVARFKKYYPKNVASDVEALAKLKICKSLEELTSAWLSLSTVEKNLPKVLAEKELLKTKLK